MKKYFCDWSNYVSFALALLPAFAMYYFNPHDSVPYIAFIIVVFLAFLFAWLSYKLYNDLRQVALTYTIEIVKCTNNRCLCKPCPFLSHHSVVSFFVLFRNIRLKSDFIKCSTDDHKHNGTST